MIPSVLASRFRDSLIEYMDASYPITPPVFRGSVRRLIQRTIEYVASFDRCDREKDYETAWAYFSKQQEAN